MPPKIKIEEYLKQMTEREQKAFHIAQAHLGSSFSVEKSNGFNEWLKKMYTK